jgi:chemotaxis protein MotB
MAISQKTQMSVPGLFMTCLLVTLPGCVSLDYYDALREAYERSENRNDATKAEKAETSSLGRQLESTRLSLAAKNEELEAARRSLATKNEELDKAHRALAATLQEEIAKGSSSVQRTEHSVNIILSERILYDSGSAEIKPDGMKLLKRIAEALRSSRDTDIRVEGHTDDVPIRTEPPPRFSSNFELSIARAVAVVRYLNEVAKVDPARLSAMGLADTRPVLPNGSENARSHNRRVEIIVTR